MEFSPFNNIVKRCVQGMQFEDKGEPMEAAKVFMQAWDEASNQFEKFLSAYFVARQQANVEERLNWYQTALQFALAIEENFIKSALPSLYRNIAGCYETLSEPAIAKQHYELADAFTNKPTDKGPFYHGTKADLKQGDLLTAGFGSNYQADLIMNHIYFTASISGAGLAAALAKGDGTDRVYIVEPNGDFENDPNVTDKKFPGNLTRSYRTTFPLRVIGEIKDWVKQMPEEIQQWRERLANSKGEIIN